MNQRPFGVISVYNDNPESLFGLLSDFVIYDNSDEAGLQAREKEGGAPRLVRENPGHSLGNFLEFIIEKFDSLPPKVAFLKSNIVPRHVRSIAALEDLLKREQMTFLWDENFSSNGFQSARASSNFFLERNNSSFLHGSSTRYFANFDDFLNFIYLKPAGLEWIAFSPGACYLVTRAEIQNVPRSVYRFLRMISTYQFFPMEAYAVERVLWLIFTSNHELQPYFLTDDEEGWRDSLPDLFMVPSKKTGLRERASSALLEIAYRYSATLRHKT